MPVYFIFGGGEISFLSGSVRENADHLVWYESYTCTLFWGCIASERKHLMSSEGGIGVPLRVGVIVGVRMFNNLQ